MNKFFISLSVCLLALSVSPVAFASETLTVQGTICDTRGVALTGRQTVECRLYAHDEGGEVLWGVAIAALLDSQGTFTAELKDGVGTKLVDSNLGQVMKDTERSELWLGLAVNGGGEMRPRQEIVSVPFALVGLDSSSAADFVVAGTARVDRLESSESVTAESAYFQRNFTVDGVVQISGDVTVSGSVDARSDVEATKITTAKGFSGAGALPVGTIMPWWGAKNDVPDGWAICNGTNRTPNLCERFLRGSYGEDVGEFGGEASVKLTSEHVPSHSHSINLYNPSNTSRGWPLANKNNKQDFWQGNQSSASTTSDSVGNGEAHNNIPQYRALYFIKRVE